MLGGYGLAALGKLVLALSFVWPVALAGRFVDRAGKGMRTAPRDALLAAGRKRQRPRPGLRPAPHDGHRRRRLGPLIALLLLELGVSLRWVFALAVVPGCSASSSSGGGARARAPAARGRRGADGERRGSWRRPRRAAAPAAVPRPPRRRARACACPPRAAFRRLLLASLVFAVGNSSNAFILLKASAVGYGATGVILVYVLYNLTYAAGSLPLGGLSDRIGQFPVVAGGFVVFAVVYAGFAAAKSMALVAVLFAAYGLYIAATEGTTKALISRTAPDAERASAMGFFDTSIGVASFAASAHRRPPVVVRRALGDVRLRRRRGGPRRRASAALRARDGAAPAESLTSSAQARARRPSGQPRAANRAPTEETRRDETDRKRPAARHDGASGANPRPTPRRSPRRPGALWRRLAACGGSSPAPAATVTVTAAPSASPSASPSPATSAAVTAQLVVAVASGPKANGISVVDATGKVKQLVAPSGGPDQRPLLGARRAAPGVPAGGQRHRLHEQPLRLQRPAELLYQVGAGIAPATIESFAWVGATQLVDCYFRSARTTYRANGTL